MPGSVGPSMSTCPALKARTGQQLKRLPGGEGPGEEG